MSLSFLAVLGFAASAAAWTPEVPTNANLGGSITAADVNSERMGSGGNHGGPNVQSFEDCVAACANFRNGNGCNTVVYCSNASGCGSNCDPSVFGPFYGNKPKCVDGKFPYQMCSLKWNDDINNPVIYEEYSPDWLSMTTTKGFQRQGR